MFTLGDNKYDAGVVFGGEAGFLVGAMTMLVSNMLLSQGPWTPWQMFCMGIIGFLAGVLFRKGWLRSRCWRSWIGLRLNTVWWSEIKHKYEYEYE